MYTLLVDMYIILSSKKHILSLAKWTLIKKIRVFFINKNDSPRWREVMTHANDTERLAQYQIGHHCRDRHWNSGHLHSCIWQEANHWMQHIRQFNSSLSKRHKSSTFASWSWTLFRYSPKLPHCSIKGSNHN